MNEIEAKVRCLELASQCNKATGDHSAEGVVKVATVLYAFISPPPFEPVQEEVTDKPKRGKPASKGLDILS